MSIGGVLLGVNGPVLYVTVHGTYQSRAPDSRFVGVDTGTALNFKLLFIFISIFAI